MVKKICFLSSMHPAFDKRVFDKEAVFLAAAGFSVFHLCPGDEDEKGVFKDVKVITYKRVTGIWGRLFQLKNLYVMAKKINADAYHCNEVDSWVVGVLLRIFCKKYCVFDVHEHYPSDFSQTRFPKWFQPVSSRLILLLFNILSIFTDRFVFAKKSVSYDFRHVDDAKKILARNYAPLSAFEISTKVAAKPSGKENFKLVHFGLLSKSRGWPQILEALSEMQHRNLHFLMIGTINDGSQIEFERRVVELGLSDRVEVIPWMPYEGALLHLSQADIGIIAFQPDLLNYVYAMPHKMFDYMACGLAVLLSKCAIEIAHIIEETKCGVLFDSRNPSELAKILDHLLDDKMALQEMGSRARQAVLMKYNWDNEAKKLISMYESLAKG